MVNHGATLPMAVVASTMVELVVTGAMVAAEMELEVLTVAVTVEMEALVAATTGNEFTETPMTHTVVTSKNLFYGESISKRRISMRHHLS